MTNDSRTPVIFWHADPVGPDETVVIAGGDFAPDAMVELLPGGGPGQAWTAVLPLQVADACIKAVIPATWAPGVYACRVRQGGGCSKTVMLNAPDPWWKQGDAGPDAAHQGGWLRILGKCLAAAPVVVVPADGGPKVPLTVEDGDGFSLKAMIPATLQAGTYAVRIAQMDAGTLEVRAAAKPPAHVISVLDLGADPSGMKDCTLAIVQATERLSCLGGGVIHFPRGRYRVDAILRSGTWIAAPLYIPEGITLRGDGADLTTLWWPDREQPLPTLIDGRSDFAIEDLALYVQGRHSTVITGSSNVRISNVRIRANCFYMLRANGGEHQKRSLTGPAASGAAILLWGGGNHVTGCDILCSTNAIDIRIGRGSRIAGNRIRADSFHTMSGVSEMIVEDNDFTGNSLTAGGSNIALHFGGSICRHIYYARNASSHIYGGDHEALTFDGHGTAFLGHVAEVRDRALRLVRTVAPCPRGTRGHMTDMHGTAAYVIDGRGAGQYRWVQGYEGDRIVIDRPWDIEPDGTSLVSIGGFNGRHLLIGNRGTDTGALVQLYPSNCECIVAGNVSVRTSNINSLGKIKKAIDTGHVSAEVSWCNQFLDNRVEVGNGWGGGRTMVDRWLGGESTLDIWGWQVAFTCPDGMDQNRFLEPADLLEVTGEETPRERCPPISRWQIVRRHVIDNNSSIRVHGAVADVLIEGCSVRDARRGIRIDLEADFRQPQDCGQLFEFEPEPGPGVTLLPHLGPEGVVLRGNAFTQVGQPYSGSALARALVVPAAQSLAAAQAGRAGNAT